MRYIIVGTAGHIDHGKTKLVEKLTGINPSRLKEEHAREITLDLGFAYLDADDLSISFVDVPGHEKLIKNMIAGSMGFNICLFAVDAREKIKAQTVEHANIIEFLGVKSIIVAVTKADLLDEESLKQSVDEIKSFFEKYNFDEMNIIPVSIYNPKQIELLKSILIEVAKKYRLKKLYDRFLMHIDRRFTIKGFGVVVTGSALSGKVNKNDKLEHFPSLKKIIIKNLQVHGKNCLSVETGARVAMNIDGITVKELKRGDTIATPNSLALTNQFYAKIKAFNNLPIDINIKHNKFYPLFIGTSHFMGKFVFMDKREISKGDEAFAKIYLDGNYAPFVMEPLIIRGGSPQVSIGGGIILSTRKYIDEKEKLIKLLNLIDKERYDEFLRLLVEGRLSIKPPLPMQFLPLGDRYLENIAKSNGLEIVDNYIINQSRLNKLKEDIIKNLKARESSKLSDVRKAYIELPEKHQKSFEKDLIEKMRSLGYFLKGDTITKNSESLFEKKAYEVLRLLQRDINFSNSALISKKLNIDEEMVEKYLKYLLNRQLIVKLDDRNYIAKDILKKYLDKMEKLAKKYGYVDVKILKNNFTLSRKFLIGLLEQLDKNPMYINRDNKRYLKKL
ncbi:MAG: selenocysteine-specific translation elongation factor [Deferribacterota bacterium]|nr:selenocysteine-specific translation elongation factor [Deferribacterota bacterium]